MGSGFDGVNVMQTNQPTQPSQPAAPRAEPPKFIEVELLRKYCPKHIVDENDNVTEQDNSGESGPLVTFPPGTVIKLPRAEAIRLLRLENRAARPSASEAF